MDPSSTNHTLQNEAARPRDLSISQPISPTDQGALDTGLFPPISSTQVDEIKMALSVKARLPTVENPVFSDQAIDAVLRQQDHSLIAFLAKLDSIVYSYYIDEICNLTQYPSKAALTEKIISLPHIATEYFPFVFNVTNQKITPSELIEAALTPLGTWERAAGLLRWLPLYKPYLPEYIGGKPAVEEIIRCLFRNEKDDVTEPIPRCVFEALSIYVNHWKKDVSPTFLKDTLQAIFHNNSDLSLFHLLVQSEIPKKIFNAQFQKYFESPLDKIATSTLFQPTMRQDQYAGTCAWCQEIHWSNIMEPNSDHYGEVVILRIDGKATFSLKTSRDPSMVALRTLLTPTGELACIRGGLYVPPKDLSKKLRESASETKELFKIADLSEPVTGLPLGWIDTVEFIWGASKANSYLNKLSEVAERFSQ